MKIFSILLLLSSLLFSKVYYSKVDPYELRSISSNVSGLVLNADEHKLGKRLTNEPYILIDAELDRDELIFTNEKISYITQTIGVNEAVLENLHASLLRKRENYKKVESLKIKSRLEKDKEFYDLIASENAYLSTQKEINNLKTQIADLELRKAQLIRSIDDKSLEAEGFTLYALSVKIGQVVTVGTPLATLADVSKGILTIYLNDEDVLDAKEKVLYLNGEKSEYKITRLLKIADSKNISKYMAQIVVKSPKLFSQLVKIELKDK